MKNNAAGRLYKVLQYWKGYQDGDSASKGWLAALSLESPQKERTPFVIYDKLLVLSEEIQLLRDQLSKLNLTPEIYDPHLKSIEKALSPSLIERQGTHIKQHLKPEVYTALLFCSDFLANEEESITEEDFSAIVDLMNQLELVLQDSSLPPALATLIRRQIRVAEIAISNYSLRGARSLKDAVKFAIGDLIVEEDSLTEAESRISTGIRNLWERMNKVADAALKTEGLLQLGSRVSKVLDKIPN